MNLEDETLIQKSIEKNNLLKEKIIKKIESITTKAISLTDVNTNIYSQNNTLSLSSNNIIENILKKYIEYNESLLFKTEEKNATNEIIMKLYKEITGISISRTNELNLKIKFDFLSDKYEYYIIISYDNDKNISCYDVISIYPEEINYKLYLEELNKTNDINLFLCKLINYELIPFHEKDK